MKIPIYQPCLGGNETKYVLDCMNTGWVSSKGKYVDEFQTKFSELTGVAYCSAVTNGTVALHLALLALGIGPGDEVIVPTLTYVASANAISYTGARPVFVDSLIDTWQIDPRDLQAKITSKTKAIMPVHLYGYPCNMDEITLIAQKNGLYIVEDCAEAVGTKFNGRHAGGFGDIATFSFYGNKTITTGEGGMVVTKHAHLHAKVEHLKGQGLVKNRQYWHDIVGYNYRMTNICAAIGLAQLERVEQFLSRKIAIACLYDEYLQTHPVRTHKPMCDKVQHSYWMYSILVSDPADRDKLREYLAHEGIETRPLFYLVDKMPMYSDATGHFPQAEFLSERGINLPSWPGLTDEAIQYVTNKIAQYYNA